MTMAASKDYTPGLDDMVLTARQADVSYTKKRARKATKVVQSPDIDEFLEFLLGVWLDIRLVVCARYPLGNLESILTKLSAGTYEPPEPRWVLRKDVLTLAASI